MLIMKYRLLLVDDDPMLAPLVSHVLGKDHLVTSATTLAEAQSIVETQVFDLVLLDVSLPDGEGYMLCTRLKELESYRDVPVLFLTGHANISDKVLGFTLGADDYITKPCSIEELRMRIKARLKNTAGTPDSKPSKGALRVDVGSGIAFVATDREERPLMLTPLEFQLLAYFVQNEDKVFTRRELTNGVFGQNAGVGQADLEGHVSKLRDKLAETAYTIAALFDGAGYKFTQAHQK
jgi:DNA-binding response OmpR family regulator